MTLRTGRRRAGVLACTILALMAWSDAHGQDFGVSQPRPGTVPGGPGTFNPTGPPIDLPRGAVPPMPPGRGSINPTGPDVGAPIGSIPAMPQGRGSFNPNVPYQPADPGVAGTPRGGVQGGRRTVTSGPTTKAPVAPGYDNCIKGYTKKRGLSRKEHDALCARIWRNERAAKQVD